MGLDWKTQGVLDDFLRCQRACQNTDLVFHCTNGNVFAHQMIFAGISPLFIDLMQRYFIHQELIPVDLNVSLPEVRREHMEMVVEMVYTGQVRITKRDYQPFREICKLLDLSVPIADYDKFFSNESDHSHDDTDSSTDEVQCSDAKLQDVSSPSKSGPNSSNVLVCDECPATFSLKIALKRHQLKRHSQTESLDLNTMDLPKPPEVSNPPTPTRLRSSSLKSKSKGQLTFECPDCLKRYPPKRIPEHLISHLQEQLNELISDWYYVPGGGKCKWCSFITHNPYKMRRHVGETHNMIMEFVNEAQKKFVLSASRKYPEQKWASSKHPKESPDCETDSFADDTSDTCTEGDDINSNAPDLPKFNQVSNLPKVKRVKKGQRFSDNSENTSMGLNATVECPECLGHYSLKWIRQHFSLHFQKELAEFVTQSESTPGGEKCKLCSFEATLPTTMRIHVGMSHNKISDLANETQKKFLEHIKSRIRKRSKNKSLGLNATVECPECLGRYSLKRIRHHFSLHFRKELAEFVTQSESTPGGKKCKLCTFEATSTSNMRIHVGLTHNKILDLANETQKKFLEHIGSRIPNPRRKWKFTPSVVEPLMKCPDCLNNVPPFRVPLHVTHHMREQLKRFAISANGLKKCKICQYETSLDCNMRRHLGLTHSMVKELANKSQMQFLNDAKLKANIRANRGEHPTRASLPRKKKNRFKTLTSTSEVQEQE